MPSSTSSACKPRRTDSSPSTKTSPTTSSTPASAKPRAAASPSRAALLLLLPLLAAPAGAQDCVKQVFNRYCLGGPIADITAAHPPQHTTARRGADVHFFNDDGGPTVVYAFEGRIESVSRLTTPGTALAFRDLRARLVALYGEPERRASLPAYATDLYKAETAIAAGRGRILDLWQHDAWRVSILWSSPKQILLIYTHDETASRRRAANPNPGGY